MSELAFRIAVLDGVQVNDLKSLYVSQCGPTLQFLEALVGHNSCRVWALSVLGEMKGVIWYRLVVGDAELIDLRIASDYRRRGFGRELLRSSMLELYHVGVNDVGLEVRESNGTARSLYLSLGFRETSRRRNYYRCSSGREDAILMSVSLPKLIRSDGNY